MTDAHRTYGETLDCKGCRYWSEMIAKSQALEIVALCLAPNGPLHSQYTSARQTCSAWASGHFGPVDELGDNAQ